MSSRALPGPIFHSVVSLRLVKAIGCGAKTGMLEATTLGCQLRLLAIMATICSLFACGFRDPVTHDEMQTEDVLVQTFPCGSPEDIQRFHRCVAEFQRTDITQQRCESLGGTWRRGGMGLELRCFCPTGQAGCPCTKHTDCVSRCRAPVPPVTPPSCASVQQFTCASQFPEYDCFCFPADPEHSESSLRVCYD